MSTPPSSRIGDTPPPDRSVESTVQRLTDALAWLTAHADRLPPNVTVTDQPNPPAPTLLWWGGPSEVHILTELVGPPSYADPEQGIWHWWGDGLPVPAQLPGLPLPAHLTVYTTTR